MVVVENGIHYELYSNDTAAVVNASDKEILEIPGMIQNHKVTRIEQKALSYHTNLKKVFLPSSLQIISIGAFMCCLNLEEVYLHSESVFVHSEAFFQCVKLNYFSCISINLYGGQIFGNCMKLKDISGSLSGVIENNTFLNCEKLKYLIFDDGIIIFPKAFDDCKSLEECYFLGKAQIEISPYFLNKLSEINVFCEPFSNISELSYLGLDVHVEKLNNIL